MAIYPPNTTPPQKGLNYVWNFLGSTLKNLASALEPYMGSKLPYKSYTALFTQSGINAPVVNVLENSFGFPINWLRSGPGSYKCEFPTSQDPYKLWIGGGFGTWASSGNTYLPLSNGTSVLGLYSLYYSGPSSAPDGIIMEVVDSSYTYVDLSTILGEDVPMYAGLYVEFRIYN